MIKDYYSILMLSSDASEKEIVKKYCDLKKGYEHYCETDQDKSQYADILEAYIVLANPYMRNMYDKYYNSSDRNFDNCDPKLLDYITKAQRKAQKHVSELKPSECWKSKAQKRKIYRIISLVVLLAIIAGIYLNQKICYIPEYDRNGECLLNHTTLKGDVVKIETINSSSIPITEIGSVDFDNHTVFDINQANTVVEFDKNGNIKKYKAYSVEGKELFDISDFHNDLMDNLVNNFPAISDNEKLTLGYIEWKKRGLISRAVYYSGNQKIWDKRMKYNQYDDPIQIVKEYCPSRVTTSWGEIMSLKDTTNITYLKYDDHGNWIYAKVDYHGITKRQHCSYHVKRQITYNHGWMKSPLIKQLPEFIASENAKMKMPDMIKKDFGCISCDIPNSFIPLSQNEKLELKNFNPLPINYNSYLAMYQTSLDVPYAAIHIYKSPQKVNDFTEYDLSDVTYVDTETDDAYKEMMEKYLTSGHCRLLWWNPSEIVTIGGKKAIMCNYYYVAGGNAIPSVTTTYLIPIGTDSELCVSYSYSTSIGAYYKQVFNKFVQSIVIYE